MIVELMNEAMRPIRRAAEPLVAAGQLDGSLRQLLGGGLTVVDDGVFFTRELRANPHLRCPGGLDLTGQEALINKLHLDDLADLAQTGWATYCVAQGVLLATRVLAAGATLTHLPLDVAMSVDLGGTTEVGGSLIETYPSSTWRFYVRRERSPWMSNDLEAFGQPVALLRQAD